MKYTLMAVSIVAMLSGCATNQLTPDQQAKLSAADHLLQTDRLVNQKLLESTASIDRKLKLIESIERGPVAMDGVQTPPVVNKAPVVSDNSEAGKKQAIQSLLNERLKIQWKNGSAEDLLRSLAKQMDLTFKVTGNKKAVPVTVISENESVSWVLESVSRQVEKKADVVLNTTQRPAVLELRFK